MHNWNIFHLPPCLCLVVSVGLSIPMLRKVDVSPDGSPPPLGERFCQKMVWLMWPPPLNLRAGPRAISALVSPATPNSTQHTISTTPRLQFYHIVNKSMYVTEHVMNRIDVIHICTNSTLEKCNPALKFKKWGHADLLWYNLHQRVFTGMFEAKWSCDKNLWMISQYSCQGYKWQ